MLIINSQTQTVRQFPRWTETLYTNDRPPLSSDHNFSRPFPFLPFIIVFTSTVFLDAYILHNVPLEVQCQRFLFQWLQNHCVTRTETFESKFLCYSINSFLYWKKTKKIRLLSPSSIRRVSHIARFRIEDVTKAYTSNLSGICEHRLILDNWVKIPLIVLKIVMITSSLHTHALSLCAPYLLIL